jgi:hypothetical protein
MLRFSDGVNINTDGPLRTLSLSDGWYVVGNGMCCPVADKEAAEKMVEEMTKPKKEKYVTPHYPAGYRDFHKGEFYYGWKTGSKRDGMYGKLVDHYYTLNNHYRNYAWVLEDGTGKRISFTKISADRPSWRFRDDD